MAEEWTMKHRSIVELQQKTDEEKIIERDWKILKRAQESEKTNLKKAISTYEKFVSSEARYPLPYLRLPIIYRKKKDYINEIRVLKVAVHVFERDNDERNLSEAKKRLKTALSLAKIAE